MQPSRDDGCAMLRGEAGDGMWIVLVRTMPWRPSEGHLGEFGFFLTQTHSMRGSRRALCHSTAQLGDWKEALQRRASWRAEGEMALLVLAKLGATKALWQNPGDSTGK